MGDWNRLKNGVTVTDGDAEFNNESLGKFAFKKTASTAGTWRVKSTVSCASIVSTIGSINWQIDGYTTWVQSTTIYSINDWGTSINFRSKDGSGVNISTFYGGDTIQFYGGRDAESEQFKLFLNTYFTKVE